MCISDCFLCLEPWLHRASASALTLASMLGNGYDALLGVSWTGINQCGLLQASTLTLSVDRPLALYIFWWACYLMFSFNLLINTKQLEEPLVRFEGWYTVAMWLVCAAIYSYFKEGEWVQTNTGPCNDRSQTDSSPSSVISPRTSLTMEATITFCLKITRTHTHITCLLSFPFHKNICKANRQ